MKSAEGNTFLRDAFLRQTPFLESVFFLKPTFFHFTFYFWQRVEFCSSFIPECCFLLQDKGWRFTCPVWSHKLGVSIEGDLLGPFSSDFSVLHYLILVASL